MATLFAWTGALRKRGELDGNTELAAFAQKLESTTIAMIEEGVMTKELALLATGPKTIVNTQGFIKEIAKRL